MITLPKAVGAALHALEKAGYEAYVVGGAVRDCLRSAAAKDWDIATSALPEQVERVFSAVPLVETGLKHGTVTVFLKGLPLEITTYRVDGAYTDHRRPDGVRFTRSLREDLARRDFTVNAMAWNPRAGLVDPFGGAADLAAGVIRCVGDPVRRFREDALRILRAVRFASVLDLHVAPETAEVVFAEKELLHAVAAERIREEMTKTLCGAAARRVLTDFAAVLAVPVPELAPLFGFAQRNLWHDRDVWQHTVDVTAACPPEPVLRWAALLHDAGKPACFTLDGAGTGHFYGHAAESARIAADVLNRLRFDARRREEIVQLVRLHDTPVEPERKAVHRLACRVGIPAARALLTLQQADAAAQSAQGRARLADIRQAQALLDALERESVCLSLRDLAIRGDDLCALGLHGRAVGTALNACLNAVVEEKCPNERAALLDFVRGAGQAGNWGER